MRYRIVSLNVYSIKDLSRFDRLYRVLMANEIDVKLLQETYITSEDAPHINNTYPPISIFAHGDPEVLGRGVAILINRRLVEWMPVEGNDPAVYKDDTGRILIFRTLTGDKSLTIGSVCAPADANDKEPWFNLTNNQLELQPIKIPTDIMGGDCNLATLGWTESLGKPSPKDRQTF